MKLEEALRSLDHTNDDHWTSDGLPRVDVVVSMTHQGVTRKTITDIAPDFNREAWAEASADAGTPENPKLAQEQETVQETVQEIVETVIPLEKVNVTFREDPEQAAHVEIVDDVVAMDSGEVYSDLKLIDRALAEFSRQNDILSKRKTACETRMTDIGRRTVMLERHRSKVAKAMGENSTSISTKNYLNAQATAREDRAKRARAFITAGTTIADVSKELSGKSPIDSAMGNRGRGRGRPAFQPLNQSGG